jgi:uncharacterized protein (DUF983 family)
MKTVVLNILVVLAAVIQYFLDNKMFVNWVLWEGLALIIVDMIISMVKDSVNAKLKVLNASLQSRLKAKGG